MDLLLAMLLVGPLPCPNPTFVLSEKAEAAFAYRAKVSEFEAGRARLEEASALRRRALELGAIRATGPGIKDYELALGFGVGKDVQVRCQRPLF